MTKNYFSPFSGRNCSFKGRPPSPKWGGESLFSNGQIDIILDWGVVWRSRLVRWKDMDPKNVFGACCQHMLLKTTFVAISKKRSKNGIFLPQKVRFCHLAENDFWTKILLKTGLLASKLCNSPFFMTQSPHLAVLCIFENWKFSENFQKKSKIVTTSKKLLQKMPLKTSTKYGQIGPKFWFFITFVLLAQFWWDRNML